MTVKYEVQKGIPIPPAKGGSSHTEGGAPMTYPFNEMDIGDCFDVPEKTHHTDQDGRDRTQACIITAALQWRQRNNPSMVFTTRRLDGLVRCWRIA